MHCKTNSSSSHTNAGFNLRFVFHTDQFWVFFSQKVYQIFKNIHTCGCASFIGVSVSSKNECKSLTLTQPAAPSLSLSLSLHIPILVVFHYHYYHHSQPLYTTDLFTLFNRLSTLHHTAANLPFTDRNMKRTEVLCTQRISQKACKERFVPDHISFHCLLRCPCRAVLV